MQKAKITREMIEHAQAQGWYASQAAREFGVAHTSIIKACVRFGLSLDYHKFSPYGMSDRGPEASDKRVKSWSASPAAIARALDKKALAVSSTCK